MAPTILRRQCARLSARKSCRSNDIGRTIFTDSSSRLAKVWYVRNSDVGGSAALRRLWLRRGFTSLADASFRALKNAHQGSGASVQTIERRLEHILGSIPRIYNRPTHVEPWIEIAGNHNSSAIYREHPWELTRLIGIHHDHKIGIANCRSCEWAGAMPR